jgi:hypothetical protein
MAEYERWADVLGEPDFDATDDEDGQMENEEDDVADEPVEAPAPERPAPVRTAPSPAKTKPAAAASAIEGYEPMPLTTQWGIIGGIVAAIAGLALLGKWAGGLAPK